MAERIVLNSWQRCVKRTIDGVTTVITYDDWKPIMEWGSPTQLAAWNAYGLGADEILWRWQSGKGHLRYHSDRHGNITALLDFGGNVVDRYRYDVFGAPTITDANGNVRSDTLWGNRFLFQGREYFREIGLYDYRHRFYDPFIGRFIQTDPTGFDAGDMNLFRYCGDDPVDGSDPTGLFDMWRNLTNFFNGNPSMNTILATWTQRALMASLATAIPNGVNIHWDITNKIRLVPYVTKRDNRTLVKERGKPVAAATRYDFGVTPEDAQNVTAHLSIDTQIATQSETKLSRWEVVRLEYQNVTGLRDWASGDGGYISRTAFRQRTYSSGQEAADAVYAKLAPSLASARFQLTFKHDGPFGTHVPSE